MLDLGVNVGIGTDGAASNNDLDMFEAMRVASFLHKLATGDPRTVMLTHRSVITYLAITDHSQALGLGLPAPVALDPRPAGRATRSPWRAV